MQIPRGGLRRVKADLDAICGLNTWRIRGWQERSTRNGTSHGSLITTSCERPPLAISAIEAVEQRLFVRDTCGRPVMAHVGSAAHLHSHDAAVIEC
jgi:hypothetical protein